MPFAGAVWLKAAIFGQRSVIAINVDEKLRFEFRRLGNTENEALTYLIAMNRYQESSTS